MGHFKGLVLLAGAAMSVTGTAAFAQSNDEVRATVASTTRKRVLPCSPVATRDTTVGSSSRATASA